MKSLIISPYKKHLASKRRIAICLSGYVRNWEHCLDSFKLHAIQNYDCDIFIHTWDKKDYFLRIQNPTDLDVEKLESGFLPKSILVEEKPDFVLSDLQISKNNENRDCAGIMSMFYSIYKANELKRNYEDKFNIKYDVVIRTRPDVLYSSNIDIPINMNSDRLYVPIHGDFLGLNDQIAFGSSEIMNKYSNIYNRVDELLSNGSWMNPEVLNRRNIESLHIGVNRFNLNYSLLRSDFSLQNNFIRQFGKR